MGYACTYTPASHVYLPVSLNSNHQLSINRREAERREGRETDRKQRGGEASNTERQTAGRERDREARRHEMERQPTQRGEGGQAGRQGGGAIENWEGREAEMRGNMEAGMQGGGETGRQRGRQRGGETGIREVTTRAQQEHNRSTTGVISGKPAKYSPKSLSKKSFLVGFLWVSDRHGYRPVAAHNACGSSACGRDIADKGSES